MTATIHQFPSRKPATAGAMAMQRLLENLSNIGNPSERNMVDGDGNLVLAEIERVARYRAVTKYWRYLDEMRTPPFSFGELRMAELASARDEAECRSRVIKARKAVQGLPLREQLIRSLQYELHRAENGMGMPVDPQKIEEIKLQIAAFQFPLAAE